MLRRRQLSLLVPLALLTRRAAAARRRVVTDQLDRRVTVPATVRRVVTLQHQTLDIIVELGATDTLVGVLRSWPSLIPGLDRIAPSLKTLPTPGDLTAVNVEDLLRLQPDVVFVTNYAPAAVIRQIEQVGLPVIVISLADGEGTDRARLNPTFANDDKAYADGLVEGVRLIGAILGKSQRADWLLDAAFAGRHLVERRVADIPPDQRVRLYVANPDMTTYGAGKYTGVMLTRSGGINVARKIRGTAKVSMEDVLRWNPQVIFVQDRYAPVADEIRHSAAWQAVDAVRNGRIAITPEYVKPWGYPLPEALALGEAWMAKQLYPARFADINMQAKADSFYRTFYGCPYMGPN
jgi:iron complex transport system substrate-binding protein